jgi:putative transcriptional regulator
LGGDFECTKELINNGKIGKQNIRFFWIYWEEQQLESEMNDNSWISAPTAIKL